MKSLKLLVSVLVIFSTFATAQIKLPVNNALRSDFQKIMAEYPLNFKGIQGEVIHQNPQTVEYASQLKLADAEECVITKYSSGLKPIYSWQALMFTSEEFELAYKKYKWVFNQLKGMNIYYVKDQYTLKGSFEEADESRKFTNSILAPVAPPDPLKKLKIDVVLQFEFPEWKVKLLVYEKEREDDERGEIEE
jgi:hypothetical protein